MSPLQSTSLASLLAAVVVTVAGCYSGAPAPGATAEPSTSGSAVAPLAAAGCPNFVEVVETGPLPGDDGTEDGPVAREQQRISGDVDLAVQYGADHPAEFASVRYENGPRVRLVIGFTAHVEEHCAALRAILEFPDEFEIIRQPATEARLEEIQQEIIDLTPGQVLGVGIGAGTIDVQLRADGEAMAAEIQARYGDLVSIQVGLLPYPDPFAGDLGCGVFSPHPIVEDSPFMVTLRLDIDEVRSGADFRATATVTNTGPEAVMLETGQPLTAIIFGRGSDQLVGGFAGGVGGTGFGGNLAPGDGLDIDVLGSTASCEPALGYALPPGAYDIRVAVDQYTMHDDAPTEVSYLLSEPIPLTIAP